MDRETLRKAESIFATALSLSGEDRRRFLDESCSNDLEIRSFVEQLLGSDEKLRSALSGVGPSSSKLDDDDLEWAIGRLVASRFRIVRVIGAGAAGRVYEATDERLSRSVALKVLRAGILTGSRQRRRLERETLALSQLDHGHIASLFDVVAQDGLDVLVMEYVAGGTVRDRLREHPLPIHEVQTFACELMEALAAAHGKGIVHGDLKPENLGISEYGKLKVLDFGLAVILEEESSPADPGRSLTRFIGTPAYMSPEQFLGSARGPSTDLFSAGIVLYEMLTRERPVDPASGHPYNICLGTRSIPRASTKRRETPKSLDRFVTSLLQHSVEARPASANAALEELRNPGAGAKSGRASRARVWASAAAGVALLTSGVVFVVSRASRDEVHLPSWLTGDALRPSVTEPSATFRADFTSPVSLQSPLDFVIFNRDSSLWIADQRAGFLSLLTHHADTWEAAAPRGTVVSPYSRAPRNVVSRRVPARPFQVSATIDSFWPTLDYQQAGIVVSSDSTFDNYLRVTAAVGGGVQRAQAVFERNGEPIESSVALANDVSSPLTDLKLRVIYDGNVWRAECRHPRKYNWYSILVVEARPGDATPAVAGLCAFHGNMYDSDGPDSPPSPIPSCLARFSSFEIEPYPTSSTR